MHAEVAVEVGFPLELTRVLRHRASAEELELLHVAPGHAHATAVDRHAGPDVLVALQEPGGVAGRRRTSLQHAFRRITAAPHGAVAAGLRRHQPQTDDETQQHGRQNTSCRRKR